MPVRIEGFTRERGGESPVGAIGNRGVVPNKSVGEKQRHRPGQQIVHQVAVGRRREFDPTLGATADAFRLNHKSRQRLERTGKKLQTRRRFELDAEVAGMFELAEKLGLVAIHDLILRRAPVTVTSASRRRTPLDRAGRVIPLSHSRRLRRRCFSERATPFPIAA